jgi:hypothetical protein
MSWDSSVSIVTRLGYEQPRNLGLSSGMGRHIFLIHSNQSSIQWVTLALSCRVRRSEVSKCLGLHLHYSHALTAP